MVRLSVVIPVYNEREFIGEILERVRNIEIEGVEKEVIIVDDCSSDGTREELKQIATYTEDDINDMTDAERLALINKIHGT